MIAREMPVAAPVGERAGLSLANATRYRVITAVQVKRMIEEAVLKDRQQWTLRLHEEAKQKISGARSELQAAIAEIERFKSRAAELQTEVERLRAEKLEFERALAETRSAARQAEVREAPPVTALTQKMLLDSLVERIHRVESLLAAHLVQDHRQEPPAGGSGSNGRFRRKPLK